MSSAMTMRKTDDKESGKSRGFDDGSPLGVAIVALGSIFAAMNSEGEKNVGDSNLVWIIFGTASLAAGLSRLVRTFTTSDETGRGL